MSYTRSIPGFYANDRYTPTKADQIYDGLSAGKLKEEIQARIDDEKRFMAQKAQPNEMEQFFILRDDFDNTVSPDNHNGVLNVADLKLRGKDVTTANKFDFRESWQRVKAAFPDQVRLKQEYVKKQNAASAKEILEREAFNEDDAYAMPMDKLKKRGGGF